MADIGAVETSESRWFKISVFVISGFFVGFSLANIIYFNRLRRAGGGGGVTRSEATSMLWINGILFAIALVIFIWSIYRLVAGVEYRQRVTQYLNEPGTGFVTTATTGAPLPQIRRSTTTTTTQALPANPTVGNVVAGSAYQPLAARRRQQTVITSQ